MPSCSFLMLVTFQAEWWAAASWRRRQGLSVVRRASVLVCLACALPRPRSIALPRRRFARVLVSSLWSPGGWLPRGIFNDLGDLCSGSLPPCPAAEAWGSARIPEMVLGGVASGCLVQSITWIILALGIWSCWLFGRCLLDHRKELLSVAFAIGGACFYGWRWRGWPLVKQGPSCCRRWSWAVGCLTELP